MNFINNISRFTWMHISIIPVDTPQSTLLDWKFIIQVQRMGDKSNTSQNYVNVKQTIYFRFRIATLPFPRPVCSRTRFKINSSPHLTIFREIGTQKCQTMCFFTLTANEKSFIYPIRILSVLRNIVIHSLLCLVDISKDDVLLLISWRNTNRPPPDSSYIL